MSVYGKLDPMIKDRTQFAFKGKREHFAKINIPNIAHPSEHIDNEIPHDSKDHVIITDTLKITFNLEITSTEKARSVKKGANAWFKRN